MLSFQLGAERLCRICPRCCPTGGALFFKKIASFPVLCLFGFQGTFAEKWLGRLTCSATLQAGVMRMMTERYIGYTLQRLLDERGMIPAELSNMCGASRAGVTVYTSGRKKMPRLEQAHDFCECLGISLDVFWYECEKDWRTESYARWLRVADMRYRKEKMVAGEGVEPPTQGFSVSRLILYEASGYSIRRAVQRIYGISSRK